MFRGKELKYLFLIILVISAACIETDIYLPAFPDMMSYFAASENEIQGILAWNFIGMCLSGPIYGPLSDSFGRKKPLYFTLGIFFIGSLITLVAQDMNQMLIARFLQGIGSGGCFTLGIAIIFDIFQKEKALAAMNQINIVTPILMGGAPLLGGFLNLTFGFRSNFIAITLAVLLSLVTCFMIFEESLPKEKRTPFRALTILDNFKKALTCLPFWQIVLIISLMFGGYLAFMSYTAVLFVVEFGISKKLFPLFQVSLLGGWLIASLSCDKVVAAFGKKKIKLIANGLFAFGSVGFIMAALFSARAPILYTTMMTLYVFGTKWITNIYFPEAMEILPEIKGITASLLTSARLLITALLVGAAGSFYDATIYPVVIIMAAVVALTLSIVISYERKAKLATS